MLDMAAYEARAWRSWQVFAIAFGVYLAGIVILVHQGQISTVGKIDLFSAALLAAIGVSGLGYQEACRLGAYPRRYTPWR